MVPQTGNDDHNSDSRTRYVRVQLLGTNYLSKWHWLERIHVASRAAHAARQGATLLQAGVQTYIEPMGCSFEDHSPKPCRPWRSGHGQFSRTDDPNGNRRTIVIVRGDAAYYARLAQRGDTVLLLVPRVSRREVAGEKA